MVTAVILISSLFIGEIPTSFTSANQMPSFAHLFGTDWMGRDMFIRTIKGLSLSIMIGIGASIISSLLFLISFIFIVSPTFTLAVPFCTFTFVIIPSFIAIILHGIYTYRHPFFYIPYNIV